MKQEAEIRNFEYTTRRYITEDKTLRNQRCENLEFCTDPVLMLAILTFRILFFFSFREIREIYLKNSTQQNKCTLNKNP
jgi:hypothetical protein